MSAPAQPRPTAVLIRDGKRPTSRRRKILVFVALVLGLPGLALAATYLFTTITGEANVDNVNQSMRIAQVTGTTGPEGVDCTRSNKVDEQNVALNPRTEALTINVGGTGGADLINTGRQIATGTCTVAILIENNGPKDVTITSAITPPAGWNVAATPITIPQATQGTMIVTITATETAVGCNAPGPSGVSAPTDCGPGAERGNFSGNLNLEALAA